MRISVITPSIRPKGLEVTFNCLRRQTLKDFEWLPRLSLPGERPDLCKQFNRALNEATGDLIVFLQDYIEIDSDGLQRMWDRYLAEPDVCWTAPVGKKDLDNPGQVKWDWRSYWRHREGITFERWEIDWGSAPRRALLTERFDEAYDDGFGWENVDLAYRLEKQGWKFRVDIDNPAIATDHDRIMEHPYKKKTNQDLWLIRKGMIDLMYEEDSNQRLGTS